MSCQLLFLRLVSQVFWGLFNGTGNHLLRLLLKEMIWTGFLPSV